MKNCVALPLSAHGLTLRLHGHFFCLKLRYFLRLKMSGDPSVRARYRPVVSRGSSSSYRPKTGVTLTRLNASVRSSPPFEQNVPSMHPNPPRGSGYSNLERFDAISKQHQKGITEKLRELKETFGDQSGSEDEGDATLEREVVENVFRSYNNQIGGGDLWTLQTVLPDAATSTCLICISSLKRTDPRDISIDVEAAVGRYYRLRGCGGSWLTPAKQRPRTLWNCSSCSASFHLNCIQRWAKDGVTRTSQFLSDECFPEKDRFWACPRCRHEYRMQDAPTRYYCYCGKTADPPTDPWILAHSCGEICGKTLKSGCEHRCLLLCHPGPCPPCPAQCRVACFCGAQQNVVRCGTQPRSCGGKCGRGLFCGIHYCQDPCHPGNCPPCTKKDTKKCACGMEQKLQLCEVKDWHCARVCGRRYSCGIHRCEKVCHSGNCGPCPRGMPRSCPCGKTKAISDCTAEISPCGNTCGKAVCPDHFCLELCHVGVCGPCMQGTKKTCPCGSKTKPVPCSKEFTCDTKCKAMRNCNRHPCNKRCCTANCPPCDQICGRMLSCRSHKCESLCHSGPCYPCSYTIDVFCACGNTKITVPCGRQRSLKPPKCRLLCLCPPDCHHSVRTEHFCHFGKCPQCAQTCSQLLPCGHNCQKPCHSAIEVLITSDTDKPAGPWEMKTVPNLEMRSYPCPPCEEAVIVPCFGGHDEASMKCFEKNVRSCGRPCGRLLQCGNHLCTLPCHELEGTANGTEVDAACEECTSLCTKSKPCGHSCIMPCHAGLCPPCPETVRQKCHCQSMILKFSCGKLASVTEKEKLELFSCKIQCPVLMPCGHPCVKLCHVASEPHSQPAECKRKVPVKCSCGRLKEQQQCFKVTTGYKLVCDAECRALNHARLKEEERLVQQAIDSKLKSDQELQDQYDRRMKGRKRRRDRRNSGDDENSSFITTHWKKIAGCAVLVLLSAVLMRSFQVF